MIAYDVDPSLHAAEPAPERLDDGFSPPAGGGAAAKPAPGAAVPAETADPALWAKSDF